MATGQVPTFNFTFVNVCVRASRTGYGLQISGDSPVCLSNVVAGSVAAEAGARTGDYVIVFNGKDAQFSTSEDLGIMLQDMLGAALQLRVARPNPVPSTDLGRRRALLTLQNMLRTGQHVTTGSEVDEYKRRIGSALTEVDDILGGFQLPGDQHVPGYGGSEQEVEISMYSAQELESPPSSQGSEPPAYDPLLDFSDDRQFTALAADNMKGNMADIELQIQKMSQLMSDVKTNKAKKQNVHKSEASYSPKQLGKADKATTVSQINKELDDLDEQLKWIESPLPTATSTTRATHKSPSPPGKSPSPPGKSASAREPAQSPVSGAGKQAREGKKGRTTGGGIFKRLRSPDRVVAPEPTGHVQEPGRRDKSFNPVPVAGGSSSSSRGPPSNVSGWGKEEVGQWLKGISMSLYALYFPLFSKHQITGRSLLRLNDNKLKSMGISNSSHCRSIATEIARLKIQQEQAELRQFQNSPNEQPAN